MKAIFIGVLASVVAIAAGVHAQTSSSSSSSSSGGTASSSSTPNKNCKVVERKMNERNTSGVSSGVSAGPGGVSGYTSGPNGVTVQSGGGSVSTSTSTTADGKTIVTASDGSCTIYVDPGKK